MLFSGGTVQQHQAGESNAVLWVVSNEPQVAFEGLQPPADGDAPTGVVHFTAAEINAQIDYLYDHAEEGELPGYAVVFSSEQQEANRNVLPTLTLAMNSLPGGSMQRPHRHNSVAVSLVISGDGCYSMVGGNRKDWSPWATTITPPVAVHSHHNGGNSRALFLIVQDGGIYYHARAMGFEFVET
jgi:gentisate 1,2-dioxygenase